MYPHSGYIQITVSGDKPVLEHFIQGLPSWTEVRVRWRDAHAPHSGWHEVEEYDCEDAIAITIGKIWHNCHKDYLTLCGTVFEGEEIKTVGDVNHIPWGMILDCDVIKGDNNEETE